VRGVAFDRFDQVGNQVVPAFELDIDIGPGVLTAHAQLDEAIVKDNRQDQDCPDD
jgi:hypothetical protein